MKTRVMESNTNNNHQTRLQQLETLGLMASSIAHDFNNLLTSIIGQSSLALAMLPQNDIARKHIEKAIQSAEFATTLTQQILEYASNKPAAPELVHLNFLVQDTIGLLGKSHLHNVTLRTSFGNNLPPIYLKQTRIRQMIINLIMNAIEAIQESSGIVHLKTGKQFLDSIQTSHSFIKSYHLLPGYYIFLQIQDNGIGIEENIIEQIFDPFFTTKAQGRGLGLATILSIVEDHDGAISVKSKLGKGTTFTVFLPVHTKQVNLQ